MRNYHTPKGDTVKNLTKVFTTADGGRMVKP